jgi:diguanylate cyclase (GGDEF)-like protein
MGDLDRFKLLNDKYGHHAGDRALRQFAEVLRKSTREQDVAARWGGEEFAILFSDFDAARTQEVVERIRIALAKALLGSGSPPFTASFGIADSTMAANFERIVRIADKALYASKQRQRDCATIGSPTDISSSGIHKSEHLEQVDVALVNHMLDNS